MTLHKIPPFIGPPLSEGPLPTLFYFALSADESLTLDPFNQPVAFLSRFPLRIFSLTLPGHGGALAATEALKFWAEHLGKGIDIISPFIDEIDRTVNELSKQNLILPGKLAVAGLSRGGFIAIHAAAKIPEFQTILAFAPLTKLSFAKDFQEIKDHPLAHALDVEHLVSKISSRAIRFYIGNRDERVGTERCFHYMQSLTESAYRAGIRSPQVELIITPSIGSQGHGTPTQSFHDGARWILRQLYQS